MLLLALFIFGCRVLQVVRWILGIALLLALIVVVDRVLGWQSIVGDWQAVSAQALTAALALFLSEPFAPRVQDLSLQRSCSGSWLR